MRTIHCSICLLCLLLLGTSRELKAQRGAEELQKIVQFYQRAGQNLSFVVHYAYFENNKPKAEDTLSVRITQNGSDYRMRGQDFEWLKTGKELLWIDHSQEEMILQNFQVDAANKDQKTIDPAQIAQLVQTQGLNIQPFKMAKNQSGLRITDPEKPGFKVELSYDPQSHCLFKMSMEDSEIEEGAAAETSTRISAVYSDYQLKKGTFPWSLKQYVQKTKQGLGPAKAYQNYTLQTL